MSLSQIVGLSTVEIVGDFAFKEFANKGGLLPLVVGITGYIGVMVMLIVSLQGSSILLVNGAWDGVSTIIESVAAYLILGERFQYTQQYIGLAFIIVGLFLLKIPMQKEKAFTWPKIF
jgi:multidrug transporter EmrE-like cation transporter